MILLMFQQSVLSQRVVNPLWEQEGSGKGFVLIGIIATSFEQ